MMVTSVDLIEKIKEISKRNKSFFKLVIKKIGGGLPIQLRS